jgi:predicted DsbA family dithiol-disulfide isomerase
MAVFRAYFAAGKNIGQISLLGGVAVSATLPGDEAQEILETRAFRDSVDRDWLRSYTLGVSAVPTFLMNGHFLVGAQPYRLLEKFLRDHDAEER